MRFFHKKKKKKPTTLALDEGLEQGPFFPEPLDTKQAVWFYCTVAQWLRAACPQLKEEAWEAIAGTLESEHGVTCVGHLAKTRSGAFLEALVFSEGLQVSPLVLQARAVPPKLLQLQFYEQQPLMRDRRGALRTDEERVGRKRAHLRRDIFGERARGAADGGERSSAHRED